MAYLSVKAGPVGKGPSNIAYITRESSEGEEGTMFYQVRSHVEEAETWEETRVRLQSWAERVKDEEIARHGNRRGEPRTHYRGIISYEKDVGVSNEELLEDAERLLKEEFPKSRAVATVHRDTDHLHVHIWMSARQTDESKVHIDRSDLKQMHETMDRIYEERTRRESRVAEKVEETWDFRQKLSELKEQGASQEELKRWAQKHRPEREAPPSPETYREREERLTDPELHEDRSKRGILQLRQKADQLEEAMEELENGRKPIGEMLQPAQQATREIKSALNQGDFASAAETWKEVSGELVEEKVKRFKDRLADAGVVWDKIVDGKIVDGKVVDEKIADGKAEILRPEVRPGEGTPGEGTLSEGEREEVLSRLSDDEKASLIEAVQTRAMKQAGTFSDFSGLPNSTEREIVRALQVAGGQKVQQARKKLEDLSKSPEGFSERTSRIRKALPSEAGKEALQKAKRKAREAIEQDQDQSRERTRGGRDRGGRNRSRSR
ncbi:myosin heavy subunit [Salinibacter ruber]|uniref:relaxase/mobilization nuclease domain-containing protein n=1 Tax=Salinibacter ruber TaxID=146919 RepID=UPI002168E0C9|nr:relaxase/mobilization nuclease domain-containing protein [Salinibacter ruber]MCS4193539.1 myosin heavy subunit [Salinibacter ruber]